MSIPAGALAADIPVSIQPISTTAPNGVGLAYRLSPDGVTFARPVSLRFSFQSTDLTGSAAELMQVAVQDGAGYWNLPTNQTVDAAAGTLTVTATHFSDWSLLQDVQIQPGAASVRAGSALPLSLISCWRQEIAMQSDGARYICREGEQRRYSVARWLVNGQPGGNPTIGTVVGAGSLVSYQAPPRAPRPSGVQVAAELRGPNNEMALVFASLSIYDDLFTLEGRWAVVATYTRSRQGGPNTTEINETISVTGTLMGFMGTAMVVETGMMTVMSKEVFPPGPDGAGCTFTISAVGPLTPFTPALPAGALVFMPVMGDDEHVYYMNGVPFIDEVPGTWMAECTGQPTQTEMQAAGGIWLMIPSPFSGGPGFKAPRSLHSMTGTYEQDEGGPGSARETWTWQITRVAGT